MSSKQSCFKSIVKSDLRRAWWISALATLFIFMTSTSYLFSSYRIDDAAEYGYIDPPTFAGNMSGSYTVGVLLAWFTVLFIFSYTNKVNSVSFFHSLPITRNKLLLAHITSSAIIIIAPMLVNTLISMLSVARGLKSSWILFAFVVYLMYSAVVFAISLTVSMLCGSSVAAGIFAPVVALLPLFTSYFVLDLCDGYLYGFASREFFDRLRDEWFYLSPEQLYSPRILVYFGYIAIFMLLSFFIYNKRNLENHGEVIAFTGLKNLFKVLFGICSGVIGYYYFESFWNITSILTMFVFGIIGTIVANMLSNKSFSLKGVVKPLLIVCGFVVVLFVSFFFDVFRYENRIPDIDDIECAEIGGLYYEESSWFSDERYHSHNVEAVRKDPYKPFFTDKKEIGYFLDIHEYAIQHKQENDNWEDDFVTPSHYELERSCFTIVYHLKNGSTMEREYWLPDRQLSAMTSKIYDTDTYRKWKYPVLDGTEKEYLSVAVDDARTCYDNVSKILSAQSDEAKRIIEALKKDRKNISYDRMNLNDYGTMISITLEYEVPFASKDGRVFYEKMEDRYSVSKYDENTWALLEELQLFADEKTLELSDIESCAVYVNEYYARDKDVSFDSASSANLDVIIQKYYNGDNAEFTDKADIEPLYDIFMNYHNDVIPKNEEYVVFCLAMYTYEDVSRTRNIVMNFEDLPEVLSYIPEKLFD